LLWIRQWSATPVRLISINISLSDDVTKPSRRRYRDRHPIELAPIMNGNEAVAGL
jgi:hypothetical protein